MSENKKNKGEIRGLKAGYYVSEDNSLMCVITKNDYGIVIEFLDYDGNIFYALNVNEKQEADFEVGAIFEPHLVDEEDDDFNNHEESEDDCGKN